MTISRSFHAVENGIFLLWKALLHIYSRSVTLDTDTHTHTHTHTAVPLNFVLSSTVAPNHVWHWSTWNVTDLNWDAWEVLHMPTGVQIVSTQMRKENLSFMILRGLQTEIFCMRSESEVTQSCPTLFNPMDCVAHQVPPSMGFPRQEYWSGLPFTSPGDLPNSGIEPGSPSL